MTFSFQLYSARNFMPWDEVYKSIASLGYKQVEGFAPVYDDPVNTRTCLDAAQLTMPSGHFSLDMLENRLQEALSIAATLGMTAIYCPYLDESLRPESAQDWQSFGKRLSELGKRIKDGGYDFGWHNHDFEFLASGDEEMPMRSILEAAPNISWEIDIAWIVRAGVDPTPWIKEFGARISAVHIKDIAPTGSNVDEDGWADIGHGELDWPLLIEQLKTHTNASVMAVEHDNPGDLMRFASRSIETLHSIV